MPTIIRDISQLTKEWFAECCGSIGGSSIKNLLAKGKGKSRKSLLYQKAGERLTNNNYDPKISDRPAVKEGTRREAESRTKFCLITGLDVEEVGLIKGDIEGTHCSPDGLTSDGSGLELKNPMAHTQVKYIDEDRIPLEYVKQVQYSMWITGYEYWWFFSYHPKLKPLLLKVQRDEDYIKTIESETKKFIKELDELVEKMG